MSIWEVNIVYCAAVFFILLSMLFNWWMRRCSKLLLPLAILSYLAVTVFVFFVLVDFAIGLLRKKGVSSFYSHNDMVLMSEIMMGCFIIVIVQVIIVSFKRLSAKA